MNIGFSLNLREKKMEILFLDCLDSDVNCARGCYFLIKPIEVNIWYEEKQRNETKDMHMKNIKLLDFHLLLRN